MRWSANFKSHITLHTTHVSFYLNQCCFCVRLSLLVHRLKDSYMHKTFVIYACVKPVSECDQFVLWKYTMINITFSANDNIDHVNISIKNGFRNDLTSEGFILQLSFSETTSEIVFTCVILTVAFFGCIGNIAAIGKIMYDPNYHTPTFAAIRQLALADFISGIVSTFFTLTNFPPSFSVIWEISELSSFFHLCLLSAVRY